MTDLQKRVADFIRSHDPFGDFFPQHDLNLIEGAIDMTDTSKRIEMLRLLKELQYPDEAPGHTILRALQALKALPDIARVRGEWCNEYTHLRDATPRSTDVARYIASHFLGADCDHAALKHANAILALSRPTREAPHE